MNSTMSTISSVFWYNVTLFSVSLAVATVTDLEIDVALAVSIASNFSLKDFSRATIDSEVPLLASTTIVEIAFSNSASMLVLFLTFYHFLFAWFLAF